MKQSQCSDFFIYFFRSPFGQTRGNGLKTIWTHLGSYNYALGLEIFQPTQWPTLWLQESSTKQTDQSCYRSLFCLKTSASCTLMIHRIAKMLVWKRKKIEYFLTFPILVGRPPLTENASRMTKLFNECIKNVWIKINFELVLMKKHEKFYDLWNINSSISGCRKNFHTVKAWPVEQWKIFLMELFLVQILYFMTMVSSEGVIQCHISPSSGV